MGFFDKLKGKLGGLFSQEGKINDDFFDELEEAMILSDMGGALASEIVEKLRITCKKSGIRATNDAKTALRDILQQILDESGDRALNLSTKPAIILVIGVNGAGKTTTIGKLAYKLRSEGKNVLLCAGDTFRAAATEQLSIWATRASVDIVKQQEGADPASVLFDAIQAAKARTIDVIICDTAGRLQNKQNLMNELKKMSKIIDRELPNAARENLLVIDAVTGQNGLSQVRGFTEAAELTGLVLTKLDGSAKGGVVIAIAEAMKVPVKYIGVGEQMNDLKNFNSAEFVEEIIG